MRPVLLLAASVLLIGAQDEDERVLRRSVVGGWTVSDVAPSDGGRLVELSRDGPGFSIRYHANFWRGNGGERRSALFSFSDCSSGDAESPVDPNRRGTPADLRRQFAAYFTECALSPRQQAAMLRGIDRAYCLFDRWAADAAAETANENARIAAYGSDEAPRLVRPAPPSASCR